MIMIVGSKITRNLEQLMYSELCTRRSLPAPNSPGISLSSKHDSGHSKSLGLERSSGVFRRIFHDLLRASIHTLPGHIQQTCFPELLGFCVARFFLLIISPSLCGESPSTLLHVNHPPFQLFSHFFASSCSSY